ncbi:hypothetical protein AGMMS49928_03010 [Spirochaetia bacterium]|nr:hypothetical protein AGMMS49928_03010 [Spirochaetia bacterium]
MNRINFEQVHYEASGDVKPIITNLVNTYPHWHNDKHYAESPTLSAVAAAAFVSPFYLSHLFTQAMGISFSQYLNYVKVNMAQRDLAMTKDTIIEIMARHGFANAKTFNRVFKSQTGCSPSEYRKNALSGNGKNFTPPPSPLGEKMPGNYVNFYAHTAVPKMSYREKSASITGTTEFIPREHTRNITIKKGGQTKPLDRYFLKMAGQARAGDFLRRGVQDHYRILQKEIRFEYIRFHGIFNDEMCVVADDDRYNWTYVDEVFDFLREVNLRPFIELSFMPTPLASGETTAFFYRGNVTPPKDWEKWGELVEAFARHLVDRYSAEEIKNWYFEVWNEPNIDSFWTGGFDGYMRLYQTSALRLKSVSPLLKIGGPAASSFSDHDARGFMERFLSSCAEQNIPVDFVSAHPYPAIYFEENNKLHEVFLDSGATKNDALWLHDLVQNSAYPHAEIHLDEWNSSPGDRDLVHDTAFMATFLLHNYLLCGGIVSSLCYWALSDLFEEHGLGGCEFHGGFGLLSIGGLKKPQYYAFQALKQLQDTVLAQGDDFIVTCSYTTDSGTEIAEIQALCWNYVHYSEAYAVGTIDRSDAPDFYDRYEIFEKKNPFEYALHIGENLFAPCPACSVEKTVFNRDHGSIFDFWLKNGAIENISDEQRSLMRVQCIPRQNIEIHQVSGDGLVISELVEPFGFVLFKIRPLSKM